MRRKLLGVLVAVLVLGLLAGLLLPALFASRETSWHPSCRTNLRIIGFGFHMYASDHEERFPPNLEGLFPGYVPSTRPRERPPGGVFLCPSADRAKPVLTADLPAGAADAAAVFREEHTDYVYIPGLLATDPPDLILACDKPGNHDAGRLVVPVGGRIEWMEEPDFQAALAKTREHIARRKAARDAAE